VREPAKAVKLNEPKCFHSPWGYDEPDILSYSNRQFGPIGANAGQAEVDSGKRAGVPSDMFIAETRGVHGVEPICNVLPIAPSTSFDHQAKRADPDLLSDRAKRDALLLPEIRRVHKAHFEVYGVQKLWRQLGREGFSVARCTVARLMRVNGIAGAVRGKPLRTTFSDKAAPCPKDHVNREFQAAAPNRL
jgi:hypothetical protein